MTIIEINAVPYGSTGSIAKSICNLVNANGEDCAYFCYSWTKVKKRKTEKNEILIGGFFSKSLNILLSFLFGYEGSFSFLSTLMFLKKLKKLKPKIIHLHNMHNWYINIPLLLKFCKKNSVRVYWTFHDCWPLTGHCPHFLISNCNKWTYQCNHCPSYKEYPQSLFDNSKKMYRKKKNWASLIPDATIVTPSKWLSDLLPLSIFRNNKSIIINNGIDLNVFKPTFVNLKQTYGLDSNKKIILGVAFSWEKRKGIYDFQKLSEMSDDDWQIVLIGRQIENVVFERNNVILIDRLQNPSEIVTFYSMASVFINPTYEDNFPTVNIESLACGTPVVTYKTGGSPEMLTDSTGIICDKGNIIELYNAIKKVVNSPTLFKSSFCTEQAKKYNKDDKFREYVNLFHL